MITTMNIFVYAWACDESERTAIRIYGINADGETVALRIENFTPYVYIHLPEKNYKAYAEALVAEIGKLTIMTQIVKKSHLYSGYGDGSSQFLCCQCDSRKKIYYIGHALKSKKILDRGFKLHEESASSILQLVALRNIRMATWISFKGSIAKERITACDQEYIVSWQKLSPSDETMQVSPKIIAFDLEVNSENVTAMPSNKPDDTIFQISCVIQHYGDRRKILLTLNGSDLDDESLNGIETIAYDTEEALLLGFIELIRFEKPNVLTGYNILMFDIAYLIQRCERYSLTNELCLAGLNRQLPAMERKIKWSSSAYKNQEYSFIDWEGILILDLLPLVKRDYKLDNYKLDTVAQELIGAEKDPVHVKEIFAAYRSKRMARVGKYCVQDANLCIDLLNHMNCWISLAEMAVVCKVSMFDLYTRGQQLRVYSQVYAYCVKHDMVVTSDGYECKAGERYLGAYVKDPVPGYYENIVPFDFCSLYPNVMIAHNICYSTFVPENSSIPESDFNTYEWEDHVGCQHDPKVVEVERLTSKINDIETEIKSQMKRRDEQKGARAKATIQAKINKLRSSQKPYREKRVEMKKGKPVNYDDDNGNVISGIVCAKRKYRFLKDSVKKGVIPTIIQDLLDSRKAVRAAIKTCGPENKVVYDKKQLAYKVSANSQYGAMGVRRGYIPFMPGAMCVTYLGREAIKKAGRIITEKYGGQWVYTDTDSTYVIFPALKTPREIWDHAIAVSIAASAEFPGAMCLEFEQAIYSKFLILSKKRYMYQSVNGHGTVDPKIGRKGIVLARRDNSLLLRLIYERVVTMIFNESSKSEITSFVVERINDVFRNVIPYSQYVITKSIGSAEGDEVDGKLGDYVVKALPIDENDRKAALNGLTERQYAIKSCPAQVQLAEKMRLRGCPVDAGSRLEFVVTSGTRSKTLGGRIEDYHYFSKRTRTLKLDKLYYVESFINPLDQLLTVGIGSNKFMAKQLEYRKAYDKVVAEITRTFAPRVVRVNS
jgi:DNA polymerase elongation subunit (family B)